MKLLVTFVFLLTTLIAADAGEHHDGKWWLKQSALEKAIYTTGMMDGVYIGTSIVGHDGVAQFNRAADRLLEQKNTKQVVDGVDAFYHDFRNRNIPTAGAIWIVCQQINGATDEQLSGIILQYRQLSALSDEQLEKLK